MEAAIRRSKKGQTVLEYALLVSVLCAVFLTMFMYLKNAVTSRMWVTQERINEAVR